ncbi:MAG TPA: hypothetical protein VJO34_07195 [Methylomirabilota bacterium]|nr:hypothetical protein [Methylomirabilota bacterium]
MRSRRHHRRFKHWLDRGGWFYLYVILTVMVVSYIAVPWVSDFVAKLQGYSSTHYEPKDQAREEFQKSTSPIQLKTQFSWQATVKLLLLALVAILWMVTVPGSWRQGRPRTTRR